MIPGYTFRKGVLTMSSSNLFRDKTTDSTNERAALSLRIGIVGGSIAGLATAIELLKLGHEVTIFERSPSNLSERGTGISIPRTLYKTLLKKD